jgi:hypothetical protein
VIQSSTAVRTSERSAQKPLPALCPEDRASMRAMVLPSARMTDLPTSSSPAAGARCAVHPELVAESTCTRCGNYMCQSCTHESRLGLCVACQERVGALSFPFNSDNYTLDGLFTHALGRWKENWLPLGLASAALFVVAYGAAFAGGMATGAFGTAHPAPLVRPSLVAAVVVQLAQMVLQIALQLPLLGLSLDVVEGKPPAFGTALGRLRRLPGALLQVLIFYLVAGLGLGALGGLIFGATRLFGASTTQSWIAFGIGGLIALVPCVYVGIGTVFGMLELLYNPEASALSALRTSFELVSGRRWRVLGISLLAGVIAVAGALACCVGVLATMPLAILLHSAFFLALRNDGQTH